MDYFVSIENTTYQHWQIELLIESFIQQNLENRLTIAIAKNDEPRTVDFNHHLKNHKRIFVHDNFGKEKNRPYSLYLALQEKLIKFPFTLIDPDMILVKPTTPPHEAIKFQIDPLFDGFDKVKSYIEEIIKSRKETHKPEDFRIPMGRTICFKKIPMDFFEKVLHWSKLLDKERLAWMMAFVQFRGYINYKGTYDYEMSLLENNVKNNFLHYKRGTPPVFHKFMYRYYDGFAMGDLFQEILLNSQTSSTALLQSVVESYIARFPKKLDWNKVREIERVKVDSSSRRK